MYLMTQIYTYKLKAKIIKMVHFMLYVFYDNKKKVQQNASIEGFTLFKFYELGNAVTSQVPSLQDQRTFGKLRNFISAKLHWKYTCK